MINASSAAFSISAVTGNLTIGVGMSNGTGTYYKKPQLMVSLLTFLTEAGAIICFW